MTDDQTEERLKNAIAALKQHPPRSYPWRKAMNQLILDIQHLPGLVKSSHPDYPEVLNDTFLRLSEEIQHFTPSHPSLAQSLTAWINGKLRLKYATRDLFSTRNSSPKHIPQTPKTEFRQQTRKPPLSLDQTLAESRRETWEDRLAAPSLWEIQAQIARDIQQQTNIQIGVRLKDYIQRDPQNKLKNCHPSRHRECHCQLLSQRLLLKIPPDRLSAIAAELEINYNTLNWHWHNKGLPLLRAIALELGYQPPTEEL
ncbi:MAG: hypothetical protein SW833_09565 [Cyanobacteriota bacterium]|nr:hypothetical protein [Cyanobacteriota bacterium]